MTKEQLLLAIAGVLILLGLFVIVSALRRARRREHARDRVDALLDLCAEPAAPELVMTAAVAAPDDPWDHPFRDAPAIAPPRAAAGHRYVVTLSDTSGSFGVRPGFNRGQTSV